MSERWVVAYCYNNYLVSDLGKIESLPRRRTNHRIIKQVKMKNGYNRVCLYSGLQETRKNILVHRLILYSFIGPPPTEAHVCDHKNGIRNDNRLENLRWVTPSQNQRFRKDKQSRSKDGKYTLKQVGIE